MSTSPKYGLKEEVESAPAPSDARAILTGIIAHAMLMKNYTISAIPKQATELADAIMGEL